jgi:uncharacterized protein
MTTELWSFLKDPHSYPHPPHRVRVIETHSAWVFLASPYVYKVKKPVNLGFLDFSTLEKRQHFCNREVELNQRLSPDVYLGVIPISRHQGRLVFGDSGRIIEYAVKMRLLSPAGFLDRRLERQEVRREDLDRIAQVLKAFYEAQAPSRDIEAWGRIEKLKLSTDENFRQTRPFLGQTLDRGVWEAVRAYTERFYERHRPLFQRRIQEQWIRDCHGDLHLEHIHLTSRSLHIYDCIEFNDRLRYIDVASDVAFLAMDLDFHGHSDLARHFTDDMARALGDPDLERLLDFYKCYRAYVRGKVECLQGQTPGLSQFQMAAHQEMARRYFRLALNYAVRGSEPLVLAVMGRIGSGKTTLSKRLSERLGWDLFSSDRVRKQLAGLPLYQRTDRRARTGLYSTAMTARTYRALLDRAGEIVRTGRGVVLDATFGRRLHREWLEQRCREWKASFCVLETRVSNGLLRARLKRREQDTTEISDARLEDFESLDSRYEPPKELTPGRTLSLTTEGDPRSSLKAALRALAERRADHS